MKRISDIFDPKDMSEGEFRLFRDSFRTALGMEVPNHDELNKYDLVTQYIYHTLLLEIMMPLRVVFGFYGYKDMVGLRDAFSKYLEDNVTEDLSIPKKGIGPNSFPNLIFTRNSSLLKLNGIPYGARIDKNDFWDVYASSVHNPLLHFLEMLWTRLSYRHGISSRQLFGDDLEIEGLFNYIKCRPLKKSELTGWEYKILELPKDIEIKPHFIQWEPEELSDAEHLLLVLLCNEENINTKSNFFDEFLKKYNLNEEEFINGLNAKKLVFIDMHNNLHLLTDECLLITKDGKFYAGENKDGRMIRWAHS